MTEPSAVISLRTRRQTIERDLEHLSAHATDLDRAVDRAEDALARNPAERAASQAYDHAKSKRDQARAIVRARQRELESLDARLADPTFERRARAYDAACAALASGPDPRTIAVLDRVERLGAAFAEARAELKQIHAEKMLAFSEACELHAELGAKHPHEPVCDDKLVLRSALARGLRASGANPLDRDVSDSLAVHQADAPSVPYG
jgi:hypothetical protein